MENISRHLPDVTSEASLRTCAPHSPSAQRRAETVECDPFMWTQQYQCIKVLVETRDTSAKQVLVVSRALQSTAISFLHIQIHPERQQVKVLRKLVVTERKFNGHLQHIT